MKNNNSPQGMKVWLFTLVTIVISTSSFCQVPTPKEKINPVITDKNFDESLTNVNEPPPANAPAREINCFRNFNVNAVGRNDVNAYLLMVLARLIYPDKLYLEKDYVNESQTTLQKDDEKFAKAFIKRTRHFFYDSKNLRGPKYEFVYTSDNHSIDPEVMLISTVNAVYVIVRGTDRVGGADTDFRYNWGEWLGTDFRFLFTPACNGCEEQVHRGFYNALHYTPGTKTSIFKNESLTSNSYIMTLLNKISDMVGTSNKKVWITGHSLGSALAQLIGFYLNKYKNITAQQMVLFAAPHPGAVNFAKTLNAIFPNGRIQRYDFIEDPITKLASRDMCLPASSSPRICYGRAGVRNHISNANGPNHIKFNAGERPLISDLTAIHVASLLSSAVTNFGGMCFHYQEWYTAACYNQLSSSLQSQVPAPPALPTANNATCNPLDVNLGTSGNSFDAGSSYIPVGKYTIRNAANNKLLIAGKSDCPIVNINNCCQAIQSSNEIVADDGKWTIALVDNAVLKSYTITNVKHKTVLDADAVCASSNGCKVQNCNRLSAIVGSRTNQEWAFVRMPNGNYKIRCVAGNKFLRVNPNCRNDNDCVYQLSDDLQDNIDLEFKLLRL